jgi:hypothetical protein
MQKATKEEICQAFSLHADFMKQELEILGDTYPVEVQEAYKIAIRVFETLADPRVEDLRFREVMFAKVTQERTAWAQKVLDRWRTRDERRAKSRKREKKRRERNKGKLEERKLTEKKNQQLYEEFETMRILHAVDALDKVRPIISDQFNADGFPKPPELRDKLLKLHGKAHKIINEYNCDTDLGMFDLAWEIEEEIFDAIRYLEDIQKMINDLRERKAKVELDIEFEKMMADPECQLYKDCYGTLNQFQKRGKTFEEAMRRAFEGKYDNQTS